MFPVLILSRLNICFSILYDSLGAEKGPLAATFRRRSSHILTRNRNDYLGKWESSFRYCWSSSSCWRSILVPAGYIFSNTCAQKEGPSWIEFFLGAEALVSGFDNEKMKQPGSGYPTPESRSCLSKATLLGFRMIWRSSLFFFFFFLLELRWR